MSCTDSHLPVSCAAAPPLAPLLATPLCVYVSTPEQQCTFNPTQSPATCCIHFPPQQVLLLFVSVLEPNMTHCLRQQPLAQTARTPHLHKSELPGSSLSPISNLLAPFIHSSQHGVLVVWPLPAIASGSRRLVQPYATQ